jgi:hypothetical protein
MSLRGCWGAATKPTNTEQEREAGGLAGSDVQSTALDKGIFSWKKYHEWIKEWMRECQSNHFHAPIGFIINYILKKDIEATFPESLQLHHWCQKISRFNCKPRHTGLATGTGRRHHHLNCEPATVSPLKMPCNTTEINQPWRYVVPVISPQPHCSCYPFSRQMTDHHPRQWVWYYSLFTKGKCYAHHSVRYWWPKRWSALSSLV